MLRMCDVISDSVIDIILPKFIIPISIIEIITRNPSIKFQPSCKYVLGPKTSPLAIILIIISIVKIAVKI
jgi:hypothetical protein